MPPSPALRCSPGRERRMESTHKRGPSFESGATLRAKDDDLALFNEMQNRERDNFLLHDSDDVNVSLSKLRYLPDYKLGITIPTRGERSDLLNMESEKNDYDWLLTPPDTPLFRSLDDDEPQPQHLLASGRLRSQPIKVLRSSLSMTEKTQSMRSSASPRRLSPSPRSSTSATQTKARPSSAPRASPPPASRPLTPLQRPSAPNKPLSPTPRSSTPTLRRMSTGSSGQASSSGRRPASPSGRRPASPMNASRGNSASPKLRGWQLDLPGFSLDAPPNLLTSLSDRAVPHVRGMSPTPSSRKGRQSMSPTARSASSSRSYEQDHISSFSKGSLASSCDDDVDSLPSVAISSSPSVRRNGMSVNNRPMTYSKKPSKTSSSSSVPKRSFDSVLRQTEHRKTPQNMFRPLLSSVPATSFYVGKTNSLHRPMFSRNSSLTTSTSASSDQAASVAPDMESSERDQNDLPGEWERIEDPITHGEIFLFDKADGIIADCGHEDSVGMPRSGSRSFTGSITSKLNSQDCKSSMIDFAETTSKAKAVEPPCATSYCSVDGCEIMAVCSKCGKRFQQVGLNGDSNICECEKTDQFFAVEPLIPIIINENDPVKSDSDMGADRLSNELQVSGAHGLPAKSNRDRQHRHDILQGSNCLDENSPIPLMTDQRDLRVSDLQSDNQTEVSAAQSDNEGKLGRTECPANPTLRVDNPEGTGISVLLLQKSSNSKWPVVQGRTFSATNILCSEPSYVRDNTSALKHSFGRDSASASSSTDLGSSRQSEVRLQRQFSSSKNEMGSTRSDIDAKAECSASHPDLVVGTYESPFCPNSEIEGNFNDSTKSEEYEGFRESVKDTDEQDNSIDHADTRATKFSSIRLGPVDASIYVKDHSCMTPSTTGAPLPDLPKCIGYDSLAEESLEHQPCLSCIKTGGDPLKANESTLDVELPNDAPDTSVIEDRYVTKDPACHSDISDRATDSHSVVASESQNGHDSFEDPQAECIPFQITIIMDVPNEISVSTASEKGASDSTSESFINDHARDIHEESTVIVEGPRGHAPRSLTLAEATDSILFCSSIVHDIAHKAAAIAMAKESTMPPETSRPTVTILGKSVQDENDSRWIPNKRVAKSQKSKRKKSETQTKLPLTESEKNVILQASTPSNTEIPAKAVDSTKPPRLESKCNCAVM